MQTKTRNIVFSSLLCALLCVSAFVSFVIPPFPVKFTFQVLIIYVTAGVLTPSYAFATVAVYSLLGLIGLPVFSAGGGLSYVMTPYFGYIIGFMAAAPLMSYIIRFKEDGKIVILRYVIAAVIGLVVIYALGVAYLYIIKNAYLGTAIDIATAIKMGCIIFIPLDAFKAVLAFGVIKLLQSAKLVS